MGMIAKLTFIKKNTGEKTMSEFKKGDRVIWNARDPKPAKDGLPGVVQNEIGLPEHYRVIFEDNQEFICEGKYLTLVEPRPHDNVIPFKKPDA